MGPQSGIAGKHVHIYIIYINDNLKRGVVMHKINDRYGWPIIFRLDADVIFDAF